MRLRKKISYWIEEVADGMANGVRLLVVIGVWMVVGVMMVGAGPDPFDGLQPVEGERLVREGTLGLSEAIALGIEQNMGVMVQREAIIEASQQVEIAEGAFDPAVTASASADNRRQPFSASELDGALRPESDSQSAGIGVEQPLRTGGSAELRWDAFNRNASNSEFARLNPAYNSALRLNLNQPLLQGAGRSNRIPTLLAELGVRQGMVQLRSEVEALVQAVEGAYLTLQAQEGVLQIREDAVEVARLIHEESMARERSRVEILESRSALVERQAALRQAVVDKEDAADELFRLTGLLGREDPGELELDPIIIPEVDALDPVDSYILALENSAETLSERQRLQQLRLNLEQARLANRPQLNARGGVGAMGRDGDYSGALSGAGSADGRYWEAGLEFRVPWDRRVEKARVAQAESRIRQEQLRIGDDRLDLFSRLRGVVRQIELATMQIESAALSLEVNQARFEEVQVRRELGQAILRDVLEAQRDLEEAALFLVSNRVTLLNNLLELRRLEGVLLPSRGITMEAPAAALPPIVQPGEEAPPNP